MISNLKTLNPYKNLTSGQYGKSNGRNNKGTISTRHRGGGHKRLYRKIDFKRENINLYGKIKTIEYDPNRNSYICLVYYEDGDKRYILHTRGFTIGDIIISGTEVSLKIGNVLPLSNIPLGTFIHNIEITLGKGGQLVRSAGTLAKLISKNNNYVMVKLPSGNFRFIFKSCTATIGQVGNIEKKNKHFFKAGSKRWLGKRPKVRGLAMNSVDHPHGGGEGKSSIGRKKPVTPWGFPTLGKKSRKKKKYSNNFIIHRRIKK
uniref:Large ribosomal subunit protein uL2m n=1 Tax=Mitrastemon kanehirai TaxID=1358725 RepID=A0A4Y1MDI4_9ERIC|nr:ribosomal protein L2 [Mitrastemon kanehirai]